MFTQFVIEGIPGAGKTSFGKILHQELGGNSIFISEPDDIGNQNPYLSDYYGDPQRWAFVMQVHMLNMRSRSHATCQWHSMNTGHSIMDKSFYGDMTFASVQRQIGYFTDREYDTYRDLFNSLLGEKRANVVCLFLDVDPEVSLERIKKRMFDRDGRKCESKISHEYLSMLSKSTESVLDRMRTMYDVGIKRIKWNTDRTESGIRSEVVRILGEVL